MRDGPAIPAGPPKSSVSGSASESLWDVVQAQLVSNAAERNSGHQVASRACLPACCLIATVTPSHAAGTGGMALVTVEKARKSGSHQTHRWREMDSNFRFRCVRRS